MKIDIKHITSDDLFTYEDDSTRLLIDFFMMTKSNINVIANSSLSYFASMKNTNSKIFLRPHPDNTYLIPYDPWNSNVLLTKDGY